MACMLLWAALLLGAPEGEGARLLKTAWASQYEWKEDGIRNVVLPFRYEFDRRGPRDYVDRFAGECEFVVVGSEVVRRHYRGAVAEDRRREIDAAFDWALGRFLRKPFDEEFREVKIGEPEEIAGGAKRIRAGWREIVVREDRIVAEIRPLDPRRSDGATYRIDYRTDKVREGYGILEEAAAYTLNGAGVSSSSKLTWIEVGEVPMPERCEQLRSWPGPGESKITLRFGVPRTNLTEPVVLDAEARDLLKAAWAKLYALPATIRIEGSFVRKPDPGLPSFPDRVEGEFRLSGMGRLTVELDADRYRDPSGWAARNAREQVEADLRRLFDLLDPRPFDERFRGCGFQRRESGKAVEILVYGYTGALGFRLEAEGIAAHLENTAAADAWWEWKGRDSREGFRIEKLTRRIEGKPFVQQIRYAAFKGWMVPVGYECFAASDFGGAAAYGILEYELKKLKVDLPR